MNLNRIRRIVSGKKARFVNEDGSELDLCYITDRIIICGFPASGVESLYRNDRSVVRRFLTARYGTHYRIFNFVPRSENEYDAAYFNGQVSRFPFPDHHPPPLSMIPLVTRTMHDYLQEDEKNVVVIHCKAGKGRSGTLCCCYLLSLPTLPQPPQLPANYSKGKVPANLLASNEPTPTPVDSDSDSDSNELPRPQSGGAALDLAGMRGESRTKAGRDRMKRLVETMATSDEEAGEPEQEREDGGTDEETDEGTAGIEAQGMADKLDKIFSLHTAQRMKPSKAATPTRDVSRNSAASSGSGRSTPTKPKKPVRGVSIPSQRRFVGYWSRLLTKQDPRPLDLLAPPNPSKLDRVRRQVSVLAVRVYMPEKMPGVPSLVNKKRISVHLAKYNTAFVDGLEKRELDLRELRRLEKRGKRHGLSGDQQQKMEELRSQWLGWRDNDWDDKNDMFEREGVLVEAKGADTPTSRLDLDEGSDAEGESESADGIRRLFPHRKSPGGAILVDADREVQIKILIGDTGKTHSRFPDVSSLGYAWIIPSFEIGSNPTSADLSFPLHTITLDSTELDFFKPQCGIAKMEIDVCWTND